MTSVEYVATAWPIEPGSIEMLTLSLRYNKGGFDYHYVFDFMDRTVECPRVELDKAEYYLHLTGFGEACARLGKHDLTLARLRYILDEARTQLLFPDDV